MEAFQNGRPLDSSYQPMDKSRSGEGGRDSQGLSKTDDQQQFGKGYSEQQNPSQVEYSRSQNPNNQYGSYTEQQQQSFDGTCSSAGLPNGPQRVGNIRMPAMSNYSNDSQSYSSPQNQQVNTNTPTLNELLQSPGPSPKYQGQGHGQGQGEYLTGGQYRHEGQGPMPHPSYPDNMYNSQQQYWGGYPGAQNATHRQQMTMGRGGQGQGPPGGPGAYRFPMSGEHPAPPSVPSYPQQQAAFRGQSPSMQQHHQGQGQGESGVPMSQSQLLSPSSSSHSLPTDRLISSQIQRPSSGKQENSQQMAVGRGVSMGPSRLPGAEQFGSGPGMQGPSSVIPYSQQQMAYRGSAPPHLQQQQYQHHLQNNMPPSQQYPSQIGMPPQQHDPTSSTGQQQYSTTSSQSFTKQDSSSEPISNGSGGMEMDKSRSHDSSRPALAEGQSQLVDSYGYLRPPDDGSSGGGGGTGGSMSQMQQNQGYHNQAFNKNYGYDGQPQAQSQQQPPHLTSEQQPGGMGSEYSAGQTQQNGPYPGMYSGPAQDQSSYENASGVYEQQGSYPRPPMNTQQRSMPGYSGPQSGMQPRYPGQQQSMMPPHHVPVSSMSSDGMPMAGGGMKYQGPGPSDSYAGGQFRPDMSMPTSSSAGYNGQQAAYWNSQMRMGYPPSSQSMAYRNQFAMGRGMPSMGPNRYPGDTYGGASGMPPYAQQMAYRGQQQLYMQQQGPPHQQMHQQQGQGQGPQGHTAGSSSHYGGGPGSGPSQLPVQSQHLQSILQDQSNSAHHSYSPSIQSPRSASSVDRQTPGARPPSAAIQPSASKSDSSSSVNSAGVNLNNIDVATTGNGPTVNGAADKSAKLGAMPVDGNGEIKSEESQHLQPHGFAGKVPSDNQHMTPEQQQHQYQQQQHHSHANPPQMEYGPGPNSQPPQQQYGMYSEHNGPDGQPSSGYGPPAGYSRPPDGPSDMGIGPRPMTNYGPSGPRYPNPQIPMMGGQGPPSGSQQFDMNNAGGGPRYPGPGGHGEYPGMGQYRPDGPPQQSLGPGDMYSSQQQQYWNNQMRMNYPGTQNAAMYRQQMAMRGLGPSRYPVSEPYPGMGGMPSSFPQSQQQMPYRGPSPHMSQQQMQQQQQHQMMPAMGGQHAYPQSHPGMMAPSSQQQGQMVVPAPVPMSQLSSEQQQSQSPSRSQSPSSQSPRPSSTPVTPRPPSTAAAPSHSAKKEGSHSEHHSLIAAASASHGSMPQQSDDFNDGSPSWPSTPKAGNSDVLARMCEMGDEPERRPFLERLFAFLDEKGTPVQAMPAISKTTVDLYKLYVLTKERGGLWDVTKQKKWREISGLLNIGSSSSAGFTLRKNYVKYLFAFECFFDRGNVDPAPILAQIDAQSKKDSKKGSGSSSQTNASLPGPVEPQFRPPMHAGYPGYGPIRPGMDMDPGGFGPRPSMDPSMMARMGYDSRMIPPMGHDGSGIMYGGGQGAPMMNGPSSGPGQMRQGLGSTLSSSDTIQIQDPFSDAPMRPPSQFSQNQSQQYSGAPTFSGQGRGPYSGFGGEGGLSEVHSNLTAPSGEYMGEAPYRPASAASSSEGYGGARFRGSADGQQSYDPQQASFANRMDQHGIQPFPADGYSAQLGTPRLPGPHDQFGYGGHSYPRPAMGQGQGKGGREMTPQRITTDEFSINTSDFSAVSPPPYGSRAGLRMGGRLRDGAPWMGDGEAGQWASGYGGYPRMMPPRTDKGLAYGIGMSSKLQRQSMIQVQGALAQRKEIVFPPDSVEAIQPNLFKRRKLVSKDLGQVDPWRLLMSLKSGLLGESAWALDTLTILLSDDSSLGYFSLSHLPGLVEVLTDHWRRYLVQVFGSEAFDDLEIASDLTKPPSLEKEEPHNVDDFNSDSDASNDSDCEDSVDGFRMPKLLCRKFPRQLDGVKFELPRRSKLCERHNYTLRSRKGLKVVVEENSEEHSIMFDRKAWDSFEGFDSSSMDWQMGHGDMTRHIISSFHCESTETFTRSQFIGPRKRRRSSTDLDRCENNISMDSRVSMVEVDKATCNCNSIDANCDVDSVSVKCDCKTGNEYLEGCSETRKKEAVGDDAFGSVVTEDLNALVLERLKHGWEDESLDPEALQLDPSPMCELSDFKADLADRCACISNIFRSLSFVPGNDIELSKHRGMMMLLGRLLLLHHSHPRRQVLKGRKHSDVLVADENDDSMSGELEVKFREWWVDVLDRLREDILVILANISGQVKFSNLPHEVCFPILDGLIHWTICPSACAQDPLPPNAATAHLSLQRLAIESLCKLCVTDINVDMILATPPFRRIVQLLAGLVRLLANRTEQVLREFAVSMLSSMTQGNGGVARVVALQRSSLSLLLDFIEGAEQQAMLVANVNGVNTLRESPEMMGTSMDMLRKAAVVLLHVAQVPENQSLFAEQQQRILSLAMSQILDATVTDVLADVLFHCSQLR